MAVFLEDQVWRLERRVKALEQKLKELTNPRAVLGWNLAVAGALEFTKRKGYAAGFCDGQDTVLGYGLDYCGESPDLDKRITARGDRLEKRIAERGEREKRK